MNTVRKPSAGLGDQHDLAADPSGLAEPVRLGAGALTTAIGDWSVAHVHEILAARQQYADRGEPTPV